MSQPQAKFYKDHGTVDLIAASALVSGEIIELDDGRAAIYEGLETCAIGDKVTVRVKGRYKVAAASGTTFANGVKADWDNTGKLAIATTTGDFHLGRVTKAKVSGELDVEIDLNVA